MLPAIQRWDDAKVLDESADMLARLALMAGDGERHGFTYPTRRRCEALFRLALTPDAEADAGYKRGFSLQDLFAAAWERVHADAGDDPEAEALLSEYFAKIGDGGADGAARALASFDDDSLWVIAVQAAYPAHPQSPGSPGWLAAEERGNPHETVDNPFLR